jgi:GAF domain-containing protein
MLETSDARSLRLDVLRNLGRALLEPLDDFGVLRAMHAELMRALDLTICFFGRFDQASQTVEVVWQMHEGNELPGGQFPLGSGPTSQAIRTCQPQLIRSWSTDGPRVQLQYATERPSLPQSSIIVPVVYGGQVAGVLSIQSYQDCAYDAADVRLVEGVANLIALALFGGRERAVRQSDADAILASMDDALLVLDPEARVVRLNRAARSLLCQRDGGVILGQRIDQPQDGSQQWPLGSPEVCERLQPVVDQLERGDAPEEVELPLEAGTVRCRASVLRKSNAAAGTVLVLRKTA